MLFFETELSYKYRKNILISKKRLHNRPVSHEEHLDNVHIHERDPPLKLLPFGSKGINEVILWRKDKLSVMS